jgi:hypothetical protein
MGFAYCRELVQGVERFIRQESSKPLVQRPQFFFGEVPEKRYYRGGAHHDGSDDVPLTRLNPMYVDRLWVGGEYDKDLVSTSHV